MGKRSNFERVERDFYPTPYEAVIPLLPHLSAGMTFIEPCAGDGRLIRHLEKHGLKCVYACDIEPQAEGIERRDVLFFGQNFPHSDLIITNPPWERDVLHQMIGLFSADRPAWLLFDADWMHTVQARPYAKLCRDVVSIGRVKWIEDSDGGGMENAAWYRFDSKPHDGTRFHFRV